MNERELLGINHLAVAVDHLVKPPGYGRVLRHPAVESVSRGVEQTPGRFRSPLAWRMLVRG